MNENLITRGAPKHPHGINWLARRQGPHPDMLMDFAVLRLKGGECYDNSEALERAFLVVYGKIELQYAGKSVLIDRPNCFDYAPSVLHLPKDIPVSLSVLSADAEIAYMATENDRPFEARFYAPEDTPDELRGKGTMRETSTRIVRTVFDHSTAPRANLVLGEVIGFPGKWSSYPPHHHPQPEIYYYKTLPSQGFAYAEMGDTVLKVRENDCCFISPGLTHPHVTAPGYALWYLWVIRNLDGNPYTKPTFLNEHLWVTDPKAVFWGKENA